MGTIQIGDRRLPERFWDKVIPVPESGCWFWLGAISGGPQFRWKVDGRWKVVGVKRLLFELAHGPTSADAIGGCNVACVHPDHQVAGSPREVRGSPGPSAASSWRRPPGCARAASDGRSSIATER